MKSLWKCVNRKFNITKLLSKNIPLPLEDSEELVRRCQKKAIKRNGKIHKNAFYFGYHKISVDRSKYRSYKETLQEVLNRNINDWYLIKGVVQNIKPIKGVEKITPDPLKNNPAHALIVCTSKKENRNQIAEALAKTFQKIPEENYGI